MDITTPIASAERSSSFDYRARRATIASLQIVTHRGGIGLKTTLPNQMNLLMKTVALSLALPLLWTFQCGRAGCEAGRSGTSCLAEGLSHRMDSLKRYECPEWFRDAKFGIWSHWGPQAVPMAGDWYAKHMYTQDDKRLPASPRALRPSLHERLEGHHPAVEGREVGSGPADGALQEGRREILRQHGRPPRQLLTSGTTSSTLERGATWGRSATWSANGRRRRRNRV